MQIFANKLYVHSGWSEMGTTNALKFLDISEDQGALSYDCHWAPFRKVTQRYLPVRCKFQLIHESLDSPPPRKDHGQAVQ